MSQHLQHEITQLNEKILLLGATVEGNVGAAVRAIHARDASAAREVVVKDQAVDRLEIEIEEECERLLALRQPVAVDLRFIVAAFKINSDLERVGDLAVNIAESAESLALQPPLDMPFDFAEMSNLAQRMLADSLRALVDRDATMAQRVCAADDRLDSIHRAMYERVQTVILLHPEQIPALLHMITVSRNLERIGDHATNIAEDVIYLLEGQIVRHRAHPV